ncbi:hypothetical protein [Cetobacterium sp.]|uniref:hypothetical protein n=1 Tax=Cetobacterium sp. TaxID=2071632 RepID=UPI002FC66D82
MVREKLLKKTESKKGRLKKVEIARCGKDKAKRIITSYCTPTPNASYSVKKRKMCAYVYPSIWPGKK